jgi:RNA polymerase sigma-70 factor (ECF subfamily)
MEWAASGRLLDGLLDAMDNAPGQGLPDEQARREDREDIAASLGGDEPSYARLVRRYQGEISKQLWRYTRNPGQVEELTQEVFVEAYLSLRGYRSEAPFLHWLRRIATRVGYRFWRKLAAQRERETTFERWHDGATPAREPGTAAEAAELVHGLLAELPPRDRLVLTLLHLEELDTQAIAERLGWSRTLVKVQAFRARQKLRKLLEARGYSE